MRKWMRDRMKRRNNKGKEDLQQKAAEPGQAPLQPTFLDREAPAGEPQEARSEASSKDNFPPTTAGETGNFPVDGRDFQHELQPEDEPQPETEPPEAAASTGQKSGAARGPRRDRSRRRGGGGKPRNQPRPGPRPSGPGRPSPSLPIAPGQATGEASEVDRDDAEPASAEHQPAAKPAAERGKSKGAVVLSIGLPGSGKSSWFKRHNIIPLSSDLIRGLLFDDPTEQRYQDLVFSSLRSLLRSRLIAGRPMNYIDATNLSPRERHSWIKMAREYGYEAHAVFFDVPAEVCIERNRKRSRNVPDDVMQRMAQKLRPPKFEEGFAKIIVVRLKPHEAAVDGQP
jgi:predicted kinase